MTTGRLYESASVVLNGSGNGTAKVGPLTARETWQPQNVHVSAATAVKQAQCRIFVGSDTSQNNFRDGTINGSTGDSSDRINADVIKSGAYVFAVWSGGDAGVSATLTVTGTKEI